MWTLEQLTALADERYPGLEADAHAIEAAEARLDEARLSPFFRWRAEAGITIAPHARGTPIFSEDDQLPLGNRWGPVARIGAEGVVPLYTFGKLRNAWRAARAGIAAAEGQRERSRARVRHNVRRAYYGLQLALDTEQMIREGRRYLTRAQRTLTTLLEEDDPNVDPLDQRRLATAMAEINARRSEAGRLRRSSEAALRALTGLDTITIGDCPMAAVELEAPSRDALLAQLDERPEVRMLDAALDARRADLAIQQGGYAPDFALAFSASLSWGPGITDQENPFIRDPANTQSLGAGLVMRWNLDFAGQMHRVRGARARLARTEDQFAEARRGLTLEVELALARFEDAVERERVWAEGERQGHAWLVEAVQANDLGAVKPKDLVDALRAYFTNRFSHLEAIQDLNAAAAELERASAQHLVQRWEPPCE